ncbi:hypothetical protein EVAR_47209_1 [Eumeta japonica]|uniref:Uncharacterized protein n=1 Tax=Eumeta variegata TaxID=151549 RepID=A0A4C1XYA9_EUMVA|nr:hypothetical protein EVAR_47209_1 [Eumeta japonica]
MLVRINGGLHVATRNLDVTSLAFGYLTPSAHSCLLHGAAGRAYVRNDYAAMYATLHRGPHVEGWTFRHPADEPAAVCIFLLRRSRVDIGEEILPAE